MCVLLRLGLTGLFPVGQLWQALVRGLRLSARWTNPLHRLAACRAMGLRPSAGRVGLPGGAQEEERLQGLLLGLRLEG